MGKGLNEKAILVDNKRKELIIVDKKYFRPLEVDYLRGDNTKARKVLNFKPKYSFKKLISEMLKEDMKIAKEEYTIKKLD